MVLHGRMLLLQLSLSLSMGVVILAAAQSLSPPQAKPGCTEKCGNLTIPYPFGIEKGCYHEEGFYYIVCNKSANPPQALWAGSNLVISNFSLEEGEMQLLNYPANDCYDANARRTDYFMSWISLANHFTFSHTKNKFVAVGCDTYALLQGFRGEEEFWTGCVSYCNGLTSVDQDSCSGVGCCQTNVPFGLKNYTINLSSFNNHSAILGFNPCSYALIVKEGHFKFSNTSFKELESMNKYPLVLNWAVGNGDQPDSCDAAQKRQDYECKGNSTCANPINRNGYICQCLEGYEGNPYLGCKDIDECKINPCKNGICINEIGSYSCVCDHGYIHGKGNMATCIAHSQANNTFLKISLGTGGSLVLLFLSIVAWWFHKAMKRRKNRKRKEKFFKENGGLLLEQQLSSSEVNVEKIKLFNSKELEKATDHFNTDRILGHGGQGTVYKGMLADGRIVAVKKSKIVGEGEVGQFINEIVILSQINHRNVVKLLGCCLETEVPLLVYEFLPNGTLYHYIQNQDEEFPLTWKERLRISIEVVGALSYLHSAASFPIYHRDIKTTNILLDDKYKAKVADFGTSKSVSIDQTHLTTLVQGTFGYLDPEYFQSSQLTDKSDVYSFGVVLVELLTGEKPVSLTRSQESKSLAAYFLLSMEQNRLFDILDAQVTKDAKKEVIISVANLAQKCLNLNGRKRPTMKEIAVELEGLSVEVFDHVQQNLAEDGHVQTNAITTEVYWDVVSSSTGPFTDGGTGSSCDIQPLLFSNTQ